MSTKWSDRDYGGLAGIAIAVLMILWVGVAVAWENGAFGAANEAPEVDRSVGLILNDEGVVACVSSSCFSPADRFVDIHPLIGQRIVQLGESSGFDPNADGKLEWTCRLPEAQLESLLADEDQPTRILMWSSEGVPYEAEPGEAAAICVEVEVSGPSSDSFVLSDGQTRVERIDADGDGRADLVKVGEEESKPIVEPMPWWQTIIGPSVLAAVVAGAFAVYSTRRTRTEATPAPRPRVGSRAPRPSPHRRV